jgi:hypothetical protein
MPGTLRKVGDLFAEHGLFMNPDGETSTVPRQFSICTLNCAKTGADDRRGES